VLNVRGWYTCSTVVDGHRIQASLHRWRHPIEGESLVFLDIDQRVPKDGDYSVRSFSFVRRSFVLTLFIFKAPNYILARTLTERVQCSITGN